MAKSILTPVERFMAKVEMEPNTGCWLWTGGLLRRGYGSFDQQQAHRFSYLHFVGPISAGLCVLHSCDVPSCVRPDHLWLGTRAENMSDMAKKGRGRVSKSGLPYGVAFKAWLRSRPFEAFVKFRGQDCRLGTFSTAEQAHAVAVEFKRVALLTGSVDEARHSVAASLATAKVNADFTANVNPA